MPAASPLRAIRNFSLAFRQDEGLLPIVRNLSLSLRTGERTTLVGESGCGKSMTCLAIARLPPTDRAVVSGEIRFRGQSLLDNPAAAAQLRGHGIAYVFQDPAASLNPVMRVGEQIAEAMRPDRLFAPFCASLRRETHARGLALLARVRLPDPAALWRAFPCELSGGMQQRVMLAMALASEPALLVADEPTTALDVTTQADVLELLDRLVVETGLALLLVTHNLGVAAGHGDTLHVLYAGQIVESGPVAEVLGRPAHPYTHGLLLAVPRLQAAAPDRLRDIPGTVPPPGRLPPGCTFAPRCPRRSPRCGAPPETRPLAPGRICRCHHPLIAEAAP